MKVRLFGLAAAAVLAVASLAAAADLSRVERTIRKEPAYRSKTPKYCLLVFGPEATFRVWLVQDGETLHVDRNGNGDLTESGEKVEAKTRNEGLLSFDAGGLSDGTLKHTELSVARMRAGAEFVRNEKEFARLEAANPEPCIWFVRVSAERPAGDDRKLPRHIGYVANGDGRGMLLFADKPADAPVIHFNGPWTLGLQDVRQRLTVGEKSNLQIGVGTPGIGPGTFTFVLYENTIPADAYPAAEITYPAKSAGETGPREKYTLKKRC